MTANVVDDRGLEPAEAEVESTVGHGAREPDRLWVTLGRRPIDRGTTWIPEIEIAGDLVERLAGRVVEAVVAVATAAGKTSAAVSKLNQP